jgi:hypothetical protein
MNTTNDTTQAYAGGIRPSFTNPSLRLLAMELMRCAFETPKAVADVFVHWSPHVDHFDITAHPGGWRENNADAFRAAVYFSEEDAEDKLAALVRDLRVFLNRCPQIIAEREAHEQAEATRERQAFGDAVVRYRGAMEAGADEETLCAMRISITEQMNAMKFAAKGGIWWNDKTGSWGLGTLDEEDHAQADAGAVMSGPHS